MFTECRAVDEIVARYDYENDHEIIHGGSGMPVDLTISSDAVYYTQRETASFFGREPVTWEMLTKIRFQDAKIAELHDRAVSVGLATIDSLNDVTTALSDVSTDDELQAVLMEGDTQEAFDRFNDICFEAQTLADDAGVDVDYDCEEE